MTVDVAQLAERLTVAQNAVGSIPIIHPYGFLDLFIIIFKCFIKGLERP